MNFDLNAATEKNEKKYQEPGISTIEFTDVLLEKTNKNSVSFIRLVTRNIENGAIGQSSQMFLSTDIKPGKKMAAWNVTARNIVDILVNAHNTDEATAKSMIVVSSEKDLQIKLSALLTGRKVRAKFKGETSSKGNVFAILAQTESLNVPAEQSKLRFNPETDIKAFAGIPDNTSEAFAGAEIDSNPF